LTRRAHFLERAFYVSVAVISVVSFFAIERLELGSPLRQALKGLSLFFAMAAGMELPRAFESYGRYLRRYEQAARERREGRAIR
jgi:hypothetical protein